jgi:putative transposase
MKQMRFRYPVPLMCRVLKVSHSGYYEWLVRPLSRHKLEERRLEVEIKAANMRNKQTHGAERLQCDLAEHGIQVGICRIKRIKRKQGLCCKQKKRFKATTNSQHQLPVAENLLG